MLTVETIDSNEQMDLQPTMVACKQLHEILRAARCVEVDFALADFEQVSKVYEDICSSLQENQYANTAMRIMVGQLVSNDYFIAACKVDAEVFCNHDCIINGMLYTLQIALEQCKNEWVADHFDPHFGLDCCI